MADILGINGITGTLQKDKIHRIQQVRFPHAVLSEKQFNLGENESSTCSKFL